MGQCYTRIIEKERSSPTSFDKKKAMEIVSKDGLKLKNMPSYLRSDIDVVLCAVKQNSLSIEFADPQIISLQCVAQQDEQASC